MARDAGCLVCMFMSASEHLGNVGDHRGAINRLISAQTAVGPPLSHVFVASEMRFDRPFRLVALCEDGFICVFVGVGGDLEG